MGRSFDLMVLAVQETLNNLVTEECFSKGRAEGALEAFKDFNDGCVDHLSEDGLAFKNVLKSIMKRRVA